MNFYLFFIVRTLIEAHEKISECLVIKERLREASLEFYTENYRKEAPFIVWIRHSTDKSRMVETTGELVVLQVRLFVCIAKKVNRIIWNICHNS